MIFDMKQICENELKQVISFEAKDAKRVEKQPTFEHILYILTKYEQNELLLILHRHYILEV